MCGGDWGAPDAGGLKSMCSADGVGEDILSRGITGQGLKDKHATFHPLSRSPVDLQAHL